MKRTLKIVLIACGTVFLMQQAIAQRSTKAKKPEDKAKTGSNIRRVTEVNATLGNSGKSNGLMSKSDFDTYLKQGITAGPGNKVVSFLFDYAERAYYEDSVGNPIRVIEHLSEPCLGNMVSEAINSTIYDRTKAGDTVFIDQIKVKMADGSEGRGKAMRFALTK